MTKLPDYSAFRNSDDDTEDFYNDELSLAENFQALFAEVLIIPNQDIQLPIITAYTLMPSALAKVVPILFFLGGKGSGKSTAMQLMGAIHKQPVLSAATTAVALRNHVNQSRWTNWIECDGEKNTLLLFDNVTAKTLTDEDLYLYFLNGYDRQTDTVMVSAGGGINLTFKVFGLKVVSTIHNFLGDVQFEELARRCMVVRFKNVDQLELGKPFYPQPLDAFSLPIFRSKFNEFWFKEENLVAYSKTRSKIRRRGRKNSLPAGFTATRWTISVDLICSGCVLNLWDIESGLQALSDYWQWLDDGGKPELSPLQQLLKQLIDVELRAVKAINKKHGDGTVDVEVSAKKVKDAVSHAASVGQLDSNPNATGIADTMRSLGWGLKMNSAKKLSWQQINQ
ncbi:hypothetical protein [Kamptonema sp. UHCC 0994]|uniref:hypothetical protein n=1 Tax=Kamptonema sp. UHCC 0994 TaxID=3031329 RepID=UPI0023B93DF7|nr:hypothetical protein [Kamptonema sp. UHCC 0994]MDF0553401.1 hypothetical protein [Kamptonema sp. UHCC 0994]